MLCKKCGEALRVNENFCTVCGHYNTEEEANDDIFNDDFDSVDELIIEDIKQKKQTNPKQSKKQKQSKKTKKSKSEKEDLKLEGILEDEDLKLEEDSLDIEKYEDLEDDNLDFESYDTKEKELVLESYEKQEDNLDLEEDFNLKADSSGTKDDEFYYKDEKYLESYIGEDYKLIKKSIFNIYAFLLNWIYFLYRKMYIVGTLGLLTIALVVRIDIKYVLFYIIGSMIFSGIAFNKLYIIISKQKVELLLKRYEGSDSFTLEKICGEKGGVTVIKTLVIYLFFLITIITTIFNFTTTREENSKFWKQNSENEANCISLIKFAYKDFKENNDNGTVKEAACSILEKDQEDEYNIYLKLEVKNKIVYSSYNTEKDYLYFLNSTENLEELELKKVNQTLTDEEEEILRVKKSITDNYLKTFNKSNEEVNLIKNNKNTSERLNYIFTEKEITR